MESSILSLIVYRNVLVSLILIYQLLAIVLPFPVLPFTGALYTCLFVTALNIAYGWYLKHHLKGNRQGDSSNFVFFQLCVDILWVSVLVVMTGGIESNLRFAYLMMILLSAIFLEKLSIYVITVLTLSTYYLSLKFASLLGQEGGWSSPFDVPPQISEGMLGQFVLCFLTALLSAFMQTAYRSSRKKLDIKEQSIRSLRVIRKRIVESLPSGLMIFEEDGHLNFINEMGRRLLAKDKTELSRMNVWEAFDLNPTLLPAGKGNSVSRMERPISVGGTRKTFGVSYCPIDLESGRHGHMVVFQDLTKIKLLEEHSRLADRMSAIGKVAAGVAHEIRNPLAAISGSIQVLKELIPEDNTSKELADIVQKESSRLNDIISQFLAYARPGMPPNFVPFSLVHCLHDFVRLTRNDAEVKAIDLKTRFTAEDTMILGDQTKLIQVFWNLLRNSVRACRENPVIELACFVKDHDVVFTIEDNGIGMTEEQLADLFTPFQSFGNTGTGLGMSIVYDIVKMHHGHIDVRSEFGKGTRIDVVFSKYEE